MGTGKRFMVTHFGSRLPIFGQLLGLFPVFLGHEPEHEGNRQGLRTN
jgi:hypothetical protein